VRVVRALHADREAAARRRASAACPYLLVDGRLEAVDGSPRRATSGALEALLAARRRGRVSAAASWCWRCPRGA
jgi:hypothetical protein